MNRAKRRHQEEVCKKKKHPASLCGKAKCFTCHSEKILNIPKPSDVRKIKDFECGVDHNEGGNYQG